MKEIFQEEGEFEPTEPTRVPSRRDLMRLFNNYAQVIASEAPYANGIPSNATPSEAHESGYNKGKEEVLESVLLTLGQTSTLRRIQKKYRPVNKNKPTQK